MTVEIVKWNMGHVAEMRRIFGYTIVIDGDNMTCDVFDRYGDFRYTIAIA